VKDEIGSEVPGENGSKSTIVYKDDKKPKPDSSAGTKRAPPKNMKNVRNFEF